MIAASRFDDDGTIGASLELGGPRYWTYREITAEVLAATGKKRAIVPMPIALIRLVAGTSEAIGLPFPVATDQLRQLKRDNIGPFDVIAPASASSRGPWTVPSAISRRSNATRRTLDLRRRPPAPTDRDVRRVGGTVVWVLLVLAIALGAAGLVTATPSSALPATRPELTGVVDAGRASARRDRGRPRDPGGRCGRARHAGPGCPVGPGRRSVDGGRGRDQPATACWSRSVSRRPPSRTRSPRRRSSARRPRISMCHPRSRPAMRAWARDSTPSGARFVMGGADDRRADASECRRASPSTTDSWAGRRSREGPYKDALAYLTEAADELAADLAGPGQYRRRVRP